MSYQKSKISTVAIPFFLPPHHTHNIKRTVTYSRLQWVFPSIGFLKEDYVECDHTSCIGQWSVSRHDTQNVWAVVYKTLWVSTSSLVFIWLKCQPWFHLQMWLSIGGSLVIQLLDFLGGRGTGVWGEGVCYAFLIEKIKEVMLLSWCHFLFIG